MKKRLIYYVACTLVANVIVYLAMELAFMLFLTRDDPVLASVPALFALPAIILQPWCIPFLLLLPYGMVLVPLLTTAMTTFVYWSLNRSGLLERPRQFILRFKARWAVRVSVIVMVILSSLAYARYLDFPSAHRGIPPGMAVSGLNITESRYLCVDQFIDSEWLWQARMSESDMDRLAAKYGLHSVSRDELPNAFLRMPPYWWHPSIAERTKIFSTPSFPARSRGSDGLHALATWNPDDQTLHVWIKDNF